MFRRNKQPVSEFQEFIPGLPMRSGVQNKQLAALSRVVINQSNFSFGSPDAPTYGKGSDRDCLGNRQHPVSDNWIEPGLSNNLGYYPNRNDKESAEGRSVLLSKLRGRKVVELGFGPGYRQFHTMLWEHEPELHVGVDLLLKLPDTAGRIQVGRWEQEAGVIVNIPAREGISTKRSLFRADMLAATSILPDASTSFVINGVDDLILYPQTEYAQALMPEIARATEIGGYIVGCTYSAGILRDVADFGDFETTKIRDMGIDYISQQRIS